MSNIHEVALFFILSVLIVHAEVNSSSCFDLCSGASAVCSTINATICYQGNVSAADEFNGEVSYGSNAFVECATCRTADLGFGYFYRLVYALYLSHFIVEAYR